MGGVFSMRFRSFCIYVFLFLFCLFALGSGSGGVEPVLIFKSWKVGQGVKGGPSDAAEQPNVWYTFLTDTETTCALSVEVGYAAKQPANAYMLNRFEWEVEAKILLPGLSESELKKHTFTFSPVPYQNGATGMTSTTFSCYGNGVLSEHWGPSGSKKARHKYCPNNSGALTPEKGRKLKIDVKFIGYYGSDPNNQQKVEIPLSLEQDQIDQMRQEYIDQQRLPKEHRSEKANKKYGTLSVPARSEFSGKNDYSDAHGYDYMINKMLAEKKKHWAQACDKYVGEILDKKHRITSLHHTGAYRNAHHHVYHVSDGASSSTKYWSHHQYGNALDVRTVDMDGDTIIENGTNGTTRYDGDEMEKAAKKYSNASWTSNNYSDGHVHAQWGSGKSTSSERVNQASEEQESDEEANAGGPPSTSTTPSTDTTTTPTITIMSSDGVYTAEAGNGHEANLSLSDPPSYVFWSVMEPGESSFGSFDKQDTSGSTSSQFSYSFPSGVSGNYVIKASGTIASTGKGFDVSYTVSVSLPISNTPTVSLPVWSDIPDPYNLTVGESFYLYLNGYVTGSYVIGDPTVMRKSGGRIPAGLSFNSGVLSGTVTTVESVSVEFEASNSAGSAKSEWISITVSAPILTATRPDAPTGLSASAGATAGTVDFSWTAPADNGSAITDYKVAYGSYNNGWGGWTSYTSIGSTNTTYTFTGLESGKTYRLRVRAVNSVGDGKISRYAQIRVP